MPVELQLWGYLAIGALPLVGFVLGVRWVQFRNKPEKKSPEISEPLKMPNEDNRVLDAIDDLRAEIAELAERQDFTERMLMQRLDSLRLPSEKSQEVDTPV